MTKYIIEKARKQYVDLMKAKEELLEVKKELIKEGNNQRIKKCLKVIEREESKVPSEEEILKYSFYNSEKEDSTCNIYVFIGAYRQNNKITDDCTKAEYFVYQNLEKMFSGVVIYPHELIDFEKENVVLKFKDTKNIREKFYKLQCVYFREYLKDENISQEKILIKLRENL